jgi:hypothetical protein
MGGDPAGYMYMIHITDLDDNELQLNGGRFSKYHNDTLNFQSKQWNLGGKALENHIRSTINWCHDTCTGRWHMAIETCNGNWVLPKTFIVSFDLKDDADAYDVCFALNDGVYKGNDF